jgi:DNA gyrase subunit A
MAETIHKKIIEQEMKESYLDYSMSVIVGRALPDVRDGLKPVHRRILFAMQELGLKYNTKFKKSATIVGSVLGRYHPHGDTAVYDTLVRMAQDFSLRYPLIKGQGNFGSIDGDAPAAYRYTEAKLSKISEELLVDLNKETIDMQDNFDASLKEPIVLPAKLPNLLINGSTGIAVGMATNIPPHNLKETCNAIIELINNPNCSVLDLMQHIKGPDFPTGGIICGKTGIASAFNTGRGKVTIRAKHTIEQKKDRHSIIIDEIPYQVNKSVLIENIAQLVNEKVIEGISDIRDESDKDGMRIVIEIKKGNDPNLILNQLYKHTQLETTFGIIFLALDHNKPKVMTLKEILTHYVNHRKEVIIRRTRFDLNKAEQRAHILEGLQIALKNIDAIVKGIKASKTIELARQFLTNTYSLTETQSNAILDLKLQKLTSLETEKLMEELKETLELIKELNIILNSEQKVLDIIKTDLQELIENYGDQRKTEIQDNEEELETEDLIPNEDVAIILTRTGYVKRMPIEEYRIQRRGGVGVKGTEKKEEDDIESIITASTHNYLLCFSSSGQVYWLKVYQIPEFGKYSKGKAIINLLNLKPNDRISTIIPIKEFTENHFLLMCTKEGLLKKTLLTEYSNPRKGGIVGIKLREGDELVTVKLTPGSLRFIIGTKNGNAVRFDEKDVRDVGRNSQGVKGIELEDDDAVIGMEVAIERGQLLTVTENGFGKRTDIPEYRLISRGGKGVINIQTTDRNGKVVAIKAVKDDDEIIVVSRNGIIIRIQVNDIAKIGRNTQGVRIMKLKEGDKVSTVERVKYTNGHKQEEENEQPDNIPETK